MGHLAEGELLQAWSNNLFRAPIFRHDTSPTDFLLVRSKISGQTMHFVIKEIPRIFLCGQMEPQKMVPRPNRNMNKLQEKMFSLGVARFFAAKLEAQAQADLRELQRSVLSYSRRKKNIRDIGFRKVVATLAEEVYDPHDGKKWRSRDLPELAPEELQKAFSPEDVCLQESAGAAEVRLADFGMEDVDLGALEVWLKRTQALKEFRRFRLGTATRLAAAYRRDPVKGPASERLVKVLKDDLRRLAERVAAGQFIFETVARAPWNTTGARAAPRPPLSFVHPRRSDAASDASASLRLLPPTLLIPCFAHLSPPPAPSPICRGVCPQPPDARRPG
jgi:hypothetical protein